MKISDSVLLSNPILWIGFLIAFILLIITMMMNLKWYILPVFSLLIVVGETVYGILVGMSLKEIALVLLPLFLICLIAFRRKHQNKRKT